MTPTHRCRSRTVQEWWGSVSSLVHYEVKLKAMKCRSLFVSFGLQQSQTAIQEQHLETNCSGCHNEGVVSTRDRRIFGFYRHTGIGQNGRFYRQSALIEVDKTLLYSSRIQTTCARKPNEASQDSHVTATLAGAVSTNMQIRSTMERVSAVPESSSSIRLFKNHCKILKLLKFENF